MTQQPKPYPHLRLVGGTSVAQAGDNLPIDWSHLMRRAQDGDGTAYSQLLQDVIPYLRALVSRRLAAPPDIEDVVQDILLTLHGIRATYDPALPFGPWLKAIATRRIMDRLRSHYRRGAQERSLLDDEDFAAVEKNEFHAADRDGLHAAVRHLSPVERKAIRMLKLDELSLKEASAKSGMSVAALKVAAHRGMARLRLILMKRDAP